MRRAGTTRQKEAGFTLVELMVVMLIIGVLMLVAVPKFTSAMRLARESVLKEDLHVMRSRWRTWCRTGT